MAGFPALGILECAPAADDLGRVADVDLAVAIAEVTLQRRIGRVLGEGQDHDPVVGEEVLLHCRGERQAMELRPVGRGVVHREHLDVVPGGLGLGALGIETRSRRHVEPFRRSNPVRIVDEDEGRRAGLRVAFDPRGPVRFVGQRQIEGRRSGVLCLLHHWKRLVGAEHHRHHVRVGLPEGIRDLLGIRRDRDLEFLKGGVLVPPARARVRTDAEVTMRDLSLGRPLPHRLGEQADRGNEVERAAADAGHLLGDTERDKGLARAAGHHEFAAATGFESGQHVSERLFLMGPKLERLLLANQVLRLLMPQVRPVEGLIEEPTKPNDRAPGREPLKSLPCVRPPRVARVHQDAGRKGLARGSRDEGVEVLFRDAGLRRVALHLDGAVAACAFLGDQIYADVGAVEVGAPPGPLVPQPHGGEPVRVKRILGEPGLHEPLEEAALVRLGLRH